MKKVLLSTMLITSVCFTVIAQSNLFQIGNSRTLMGQGTLDETHGSRIRMENVSGVNNLLWLQNHTTSAAGATLHAARSLGPSGLNIAIWATAKNTTVQPNAGAYGLYCSAGNGKPGSNYGVFSFLVGSNDGTALFGMSEVGMSETIIGGRFAGYFMGRVYMSERLGIGQNYPSYPLDVNGTIRCTTLTQTSDLRAKTNITNLGSKINQVGQLRAVKYNLLDDDIQLRASQAKAVADTGKTVTDMRMHLGLEEKKDKDREHIGFIAQEVKTVFPELVYEDEKGVLSIDYLSLIPILVETIQELNKRLEAVENKQSPGIVKEKQ